MPKPGDLIVVHIIDKRQVGDNFARKRLAWPLHATLVRWFTPASIEACTPALQQVADRHGPFEVMVGDEADFGPEGITRVNLINDSKPLQALHQELLTAVQESGGKFESERWLGDEYRAHVTHHGEQRKHKGDILLIGDFHLVVVDSEDTCTIIKKFDLKPTV